MATARTATGAKLMFTLDGVACGFVDAVDGGGIEADLVEEKVGNQTRRAIGAFKYEPLTVDTDFTLAHAVYDWITATWSGTFARKSCSVTVADAQLNARSVERCQNALLTGVTLSALDAASKEPLRLTLAIAAETVQNATAGGKLAAAGTSQKRSLASSFRLELDGVDCTGVRRIESFTVQVDLTEDRTGTAREPVWVPAKLEFPNLTITLADNPKADDWWTWADAFIVSGTNSQEKNGAIVVLAPDLKTEVARVQLHGVGICGLRHSRRAANDASVPTLVAELYCEAMTLQVGAPAPLPVHKPIADPHPVIPIR